MKIVALFSLLLLLFASTCDRQVAPGDSDPNPFYRVMFYNVENLFDVVDDPQTNDQEFLPESSKSWTKKRYENKLDKIARVIRDLGGDTLPAVIGLCEIENRFTLDDLTRRSPLKNAGYQIVHQESPDQRGIDVGLLYRSGYFKLLNHRFIRVTFPDEPHIVTRDILYASGILGKIDTLHLFVSHWPSRSGGEVPSRPRRIQVGELIRHAVDSVKARSPEARIIIMGDFNDEPHDLSVQKGLGAVGSAETLDPHGLYDLTGILKNGKPGGTYKYLGTWNLLDHFVVSGIMLDTTALLYTKPTDMRVFSPEYLLERDEKYLGVKPARTYGGPVYWGGYSDHLPIYLNIRYRREK